MNIHKGIKINCTLDTLFNRWFEQLAPIHHLTARELEIAAALVRKRYYLSLKIPDEKLLDEALMMESTKKEICEECKMTFSHLQVMLGKFRKSEVLQGNKINPKFIPTITQDNQTFNLVIIFDMTKCNTKK